MIARQYEVVSASASEAEKQYAKAASDTISQLLARVLGQLSLSAWLPAAALVLVVAGMVRFGSEGGTVGSPSAPVKRTLAAAADVSFGGVVVLLLVVVVATMVTQAFAFEAIRFLEGYWGPRGWARRLEARRCRRHLDALVRLQTDYERDVWTAWLQVEEALASSATAVSPWMLLKLRERITGVPAGVETTSEASASSRELDWEALADGAIVRSIRVHEIRLRDYPLDVSRVMPTRLGNVLRRHEVETGREDVEGLVERVYDRLPFTLQLSHDEQRARLELYCSMVFVLWVCAVGAIVIFAWGEWPTALAFAGALVAVSAVAYRAAVSSARYYGLLLLRISEWDLNNPVSETGTPG